MRSFLCAFVTVLSVGCGVEVPEWTQPLRPGEQRGATPSDVDAPAADGLEPATDTAALDYDVELVVSPPSLEVAAGTSVVGRLEVRLVGAPGSAVQLRVTPDGLPDHVLAELMPASLDASGLAVFSIRPTATVPASQTLLELEATVGLLRRRVTVPLVITPP